MRFLANALLGIGGLVFVVGIAARLFNQIWLFWPGTYWKGAVGCAAFAIALILMEIRDRTPRAA